MKHFLKACKSCGLINLRPISSVCKVCADKRRKEYLKEYARSYMRDYKSIKKESFRKSI